MDDQRKVRSAERPPSPTAPKGSRFRNPRIRVATGAAVVSLALATALGPAAADELMSDDAPVSTEVIRSESPIPSTTAPAPEEMTKAEKGPSQHDKAVLVLTLVKQQREAEAAFRRLADHAAAEAASQQAAADAAARTAADAAESSDHDAPSAEPAAPSGGGGGVWDALAECESGGDWSINTGNGYYGGLQFSLSTWRAMGGSGLPSENSRAAQIAVAERLQASQGWGAWPSCSSKLGLG